MNSTYKNAERCDKAQEILYKQEAIKMSENSDKLLQIT